MKNIIKPTLLISKSRIIQNIITMKDKVDRSGIIFRPHFKSHQSQLVSKIYRTLGINKITVSSIDMAIFFADQGWEDITIAFPVNIRQIDDLNDLAQRISLNLLVESKETVTYLEKHLNNLVNMWIKIDIGYHRTGISFDEADLILNLANFIVSSNNLHFVGLLTHAGHSYTADFNQKKTIFENSITQLTYLKDHLLRSGISSVKLSYGDTPTCSIFNDFSAFDELRPGNFVFYDLMQHSFGSCTEDKIAVLVACPVVAVHKESNKIIIHGGGVHFSKDFLTTGNGRLYGYVVGHNDDIWWNINTGNFIFSISQEHGEVRITDLDLLNTIKIGDLLYFYPVHSCMAANLMKENTILID